MRRIGPRIALAAAFALAACSPSGDGSTAPLRSLGGVANTTQPPEPGFIRACKVSGPAGTYTFAVSVQGGGDYTLPGGSQQSVNFDGGGEVCVTMYAQILNETWGAGETAQVTISELVPEGMSVAAIDVRYPFVSGAPTTTYTGTSSITVTVVVTDRIKMMFHNVNQPPPPPPPVAATCYSFTGVAGVAMTPVQLTASGGVGGPYTFTATGLPAGLSLSTSGVLSGTPTVTGSFNYTVTATDAEGNSSTSGGCTVTITPPPPPPGGEGCTPGYWKTKQHLDSWASTPYAPSQLISTVFNVPASLTLNGHALGSYTMLKGLSFQGGSSVSQKAETLLRAAIAGVLNSGAVNYGMSTADVISQVNAALASLDGNAMITLAGTLDVLNNKGCPLN